jgi:hypothetical protein
MNSLAEKGYFVLPKWRWLAEGTNDGRPNGENIISFQIVEQKFGNSTRRFC